MTFERIALPGFAAAVLAAAGDGRRHERAAILAALRAAAGRFRTGAAVLDCLVPPGAGAAALLPRGVWMAEGAAWRGGAALLLRARVPEAAVDWPATVAFRLSVAHLEGGGEDRGHGYLLDRGAGVRLVSLWRLEPARDPEPAHHDLWGCALTVRRDAP